MWKLINLYVKCAKLIKVFNFLFVFFFTPINRKWKCGSTTWPFCIRFCVAWDRVNNELQCTLTYVYLCMSNCLAFQIWLSFNTTEQTANFIKDNWKSQKEIIVFPTYVNHLAIVRGETYIETSLVLVHCCTNHNGPYEVDNVEGHGCPHVDLKLWLHLFTGADTMELVRLGWQTETVE